MPTSKAFGFYNAMDFAFGATQTVPALVIGTGNGATGASTIGLQFATATTPDGRVFTPMAVNNPVLVGDGTNQETVTPTSVSQTTPAVYNTASFAGSFNNLHGMGETVQSSTYGLQEAINVAAGGGGGIVCVNATWAAAGGTSAMLAAASLPANGSVIIEDQRGPGVQYWANRPTSATVVSAPSAATSGTVASQTATGTWTATTIHVQFTYVTAAGGESLASADYSFTATASVAIGGSGPAAATGAVGYRVYIGTTAWQAPLIAANGTVIQCGPIKAFAIGTPFSIATATTNAFALVPNVSSAFSAVLPQSSAVLPQNFQTTWPSFGNVGAISAATATTLGQLNLPTGFLNQFGRVVRIKGTAAITTNSATGTLTINLNLYSVWGKTSINPFTVASPSFAAGSAVVNCEFECLMTTSLAGATGTVEAHGTVAFSEAGTAVATMAMDFIHAASSAIDLTAQNTLEVSITTATIAPTAGTLRQLTVEVLN
jgi:hypothetical protein